MDFISELLDCILSDIISNLSMKDLLKTSILSKRWCKVWSLRRNLNFDIHNVLGNEEELLASGYLINVLRNSITFKRLDSDNSRSEFINRVNHFVGNFQGTKIDSFLVDFYLTHKQSSVINQWISFAIARGVERIDLLFARSRHEHRLKKPFKFQFDLFSKSNASTLKHMCLRYCIVSQPTNLEFSPFKNLRSLMLEDAYLEEVFLTKLFSSCLLLEELRLHVCNYKSSLLKIVSSSLCHLVVERCFVLQDNVMEYSIKLSSLECPKLTSLESDLEMEVSSFNTPLLKSINFHYLTSYKFQHTLSFLSTLPHLETLHLPNSCFKESFSFHGIGHLKHLRELNVIICGLDIDKVGFDVVWTLNFLQATPFLQKLSIMVIYPGLCVNKKNVGDLGFTLHNELKVVEVKGCVGNWYEIEFAKNILKYAHKLEQIVLSPYWRDYEFLNWNWREHVFSNWNSNPEWFQNGRERIREELQSQGVRYDKLILI